MYDRLLGFYVGIEAAWAVVGERRRRDQRGEGVISAAIAVLVMAAIGALMWTSFRAIWDETEQKTEDRVREIGE